MLNQDDVPPFATGGYTGVGGDTIPGALPDNGYVIPKASLAQFDAAITEFQRKLRKPTPTIGRIVHYTLAQEDANEINRRRTDSRDHRDIRPSDGSQVHVGNRVQAGDVFPLIITRVWAANSINGQVFLDGNDTFWALSVSEGEGERRYQWPNTAPKTEVAP